MISVSGKELITAGRDAVNRPAWVSGVALCLLVSLGGCSLFSDKPKPAPLESLQPKLAARLAWSAEQGRVDFPMQPAVALGQVATAASDGTVTVRPLDRAAATWTARAGQRLTAGVGFDGLRAAVVTDTNELVALAGGRVIWRKRLVSGVSTPPLVAGERIFVLGLDRAVDAYDALDGRYLWRLQRSSDPLSLQLPAVLMPFGELLLVGQGSRLAGVDPDRGQVRWELPITLPRGSNEVERLADLVGPAVRAGQSVCVRSFQNAVACANLERRTVSWTRNTGGAQAVALASQVVVGGDGSDRVSGWNAESGELLWSHERLLHRGLGGMSAWGPWAVVGDAEGQVHVFDPKTGQTVQRLATDGSAIVAAPRVDGRTMVAVTRKGGIYAWQLP